MTIHVLNVQPLVQLYAYLQHVQNVPITATVVLLPSHRIVWSLDPPTQPLYVLAKTLHQWMTTNTQGNISMTRNVLLRRLQCTPTSVLTPLFHTLATVLAPPSVDTTTHEAALTSLLNRPSPKQQITWNVATAVRSLGKSWTQMSQRLRKALSTNETRTHVNPQPVSPPSAIPLAEVIDRVCMPTLTSRSHPVVLHWTRNDAGSSAEPENVRLIRYMPGYINTRGYPIECRIRRLTKTGSSAYKSVSVETLSFPPGSVPPGLMAEDHRKSPETRLARRETLCAPSSGLNSCSVLPTRNIHGAQPDHWPTETTPIIPPPRVNMTPTIATLANLPMRTDAPLQTPHHVGRLYVQIGMSGVTPVGVYTESRLDDGTTLRLYTFEREPHKVYTQRSRRRTNGVKL